MINGIDVIIPSYNSEGSIEKLIRDIEFYSKNQPFNLNKIIVVNDCSTDDTENILLQLSKKNSLLKTINNKKNLGQVKATLKGIEHSVSEYIVTLDDDLQHPPSEISKLVNKLCENDYDFIIANWDADETKFRNFTSFIAGSLFNFFSFGSLNFKNTAFRCINSRIKDKILLKLKNDTILDLRKISDNYSTVDVEHNSKPHNRSYMPFKRRFLIAVKHLLKDTYFLVFFTLLLLIFNFLVK